MNYNLTNLFVLGIGGRSSMHTGTVKFFNNAKGYGFIIVDGDTDKEVFVHFSAIKQDGYKSLNEGDKVKFEIVEEERGEKAVEVEVTEAAISEEEAAEARSEEVIDSFMS